jgi:hypothetical protein
VSLYVQLSTALPDDPRMIEAGPMAELVYVRAVMRCREALSDGVIHRARLGRWFAGIPRVERHLDALARVGLIETHADGWRIPIDVWCKWNPTKAEVLAKRDAEKERKRSYRDRVRGTSEDVPTGQERHATSPGKQPEPEPEPEPEPSKDPAATTLEPTTTEPKRRRSWSDRTDTLTRQYRDWYKDQKGFACPQSHMVLAKIIERFAEVDRDRLVTALKACATVSVRAIELELNRTARPDVVSRTEQRRRLVDHVAQIGTPTATHPAVAAVFALPTGDRP